MLMLDLLGSKDPVLLVGFVALFGKLSIILFLKAKIIVSQLKQSTIRFTACFSLFVLYSLSVLLLFFSPKTIDQRITRLILLCCKQARYPTDFVVLYWIFDQQNIFYKRFLFVLLNWSIFDFNPLCVTVTLFQRFTSFQREIWMRTACNDSC